MTIRQLRDAVAGTSTGLPTLQEWLDRTVEIDPAVADAVAGIYCGSEGRGSEGRVVSEPIDTYSKPGHEHSVVMGWFGGRVEYAYLS